MAISRKQYDENGNVIELSYYGKKGERINNKDGFSFVRYKRNENGRIIEYTYYDPHEKLTEYNDAAIVQINYNERGNETEIWFLGKDKKSAKKALIRYIYDENGLFKHKKYYDNNGKEIT